MRELSNKQYEAIADKLGKSLNELERLDFRPCFMRHERIKPSSMHKPDDAIEPDDDYTPICNDVVRNRNPNCNHLDPSNPVSRAITAVSTYALYADDHNTTIQDIHERWTASMHKRELIDNNVVTLLPSARTNDTDAELVQLERARHTDETEVVQKICNDLQVLVLKILEEIKKILDSKMTL